MIITDIKKQVKRQGRYSIFLAGKYAFSLSESALFEQKLSVGQELSTAQIRELKQVSDDDKLYQMTLQYIAIRLRSKWEIETYLQRKSASPALTELILNKLSINNFIDDERYAAAYVRDSRLLRPMSKRRLILELQKKRIDKSIINRVIEEESVEDSTALSEVIARKRRQSRYQDNQKLLQYLARQGYNYDDIKAALQED